MMWRRAAHVGGFSLWTILVSVSVVLPLGVSAQPSDQPVWAIQTLSTASVEVYWTSERIRTAAPMPLPELFPTLGAVPTPAAGSRLTVIANSGGPGAVPLEHTSELAAAAPEPLFGAAPFSYTRYRLFPDSSSQYKIFPYRVTGKLFFTIPGQGNFTCSAASVNSANQSVVWTAGHCVYTPGTGFHTNFLFAPGRRAGTNPYGTWTPKAVATLAGWQNGLLEYDHGALVMKLGGNTLTKQKVGVRVGFLGFLANVARQQHWHVHGYPAAPRDLSSTPPGAQFDGEHHEICAAPWAIDDQPTGTSGVDPPTIGIGCDQTGGASGGPWVVDFSGAGGQTNLLNGNTNYRYTGGPPNNLELYSPYFSDGAVNLRNSAQAVPVP